MSINSARILQCSNPAFFVVATQASMIPPSVVLSRFDLQNVADANGPIVVNSGAEHLADGLRLLDQVAARWL